MDDIGRDRKEFNDMMEESLEQLGNLLPSILSKLLGSRYPKITIFLQVRMDAT